MGVIIRFFEKFWITILLCTVILYLCFMNASSIPQIEMSNFDKFVHFCMFSGLCGIIYFEQSRFFRKPIPAKWIVLGAWLFSITFSGVIELLQEYLTTDRSGDWMDFLCDFLGSTTALVICLLINKKLTKAKI